MSSLFSALERAASSALHFFMRLSDRAAREVSSSLSLSWGTLAEMASFTRMESATVVMYARTLG